MLTTLVCDPALLEKDLSGRVYVVTGANSGVGFAPLITPTTLGRCMWG